jgi:glycerol-3-phosphate dehydrogenase
MINRFTQSDLNKEFDVIIIGGGINGCGIARDAALRGLSVLLLEKEDFGYGCTSASTRLIHGGLRYLEYFEFSLVRESLIERELLLKNASHLVKPIELCIPIYKNDKRSFFEIKAGMLLYDLLSFDKTLPCHKMMSKEEFIKFEPGVNSDNLVGAAIYYDAQVTYPERICVENAIMAAQASAMVINHAEVITLKNELRKITSLTFLDRLSDKQFTVKGKQIINVSGPWVDKLCSLASNDIKRKIGGTKGSHIIVNKFPGAPTHAVYSSAKSDNRPFFIIPWNDLILIGTTDIHYDEDLDSISASKSEVDYLLSEANSLVPGYKLEKKDILYTYSGIRPLPYISNTKPGAITRKHIIFDHKDEGISNLISVIGGKLTTYRNLSEQATDLLFKKLGRKKVECMTMEIPFIGNQNLCLSEPDYAYTVSDVLLRRSFLGLNPDLGMPSVEKLSNALKEKYGYSDDEIKKQVDEYEKTVSLRQCLLVET